MTEPTAATYEAKGISGEGHADIAGQIIPPNAPAEPGPEHASPEPEPTPAKGEGGQPADPPPDAATSSGTQAPVEASAEAEGDDPETPYFRDKDGKFRKGSKREIRGIVSKQQKRIDTLTAKLREREAIASQPAVTPAAPVTAGGDDPKPTLDKFDTYEDFVEATGRWSARQEWKQQQAVKQQESAQTETGQLQHELITARVEAFAAEHQDYDQVIANSVLADYQLPPILYQILSSDERGPEMAYYLAKHPDDALALARESLDLPVSAATVEWMRRKVLTRLGAATPARGSAPQAPSLSLAPPPMRPVSGGANTATVPLDKLTADVDGDFDQVRPQWRKAMRG